MGAPERTVSDLRSFYPAVRSVALVRLDLHAFEMNCQTSPSNAYNSSFLSGID